eukprot:CAMPEP_0170459634 /NCGR_PEP_ID=MMETSP0123-20130129/6259_1 /TAXON_ID=182087 /ORGANISM="Favella ehrenbergii, Strain Fehren 1" /LENGTH=51 /DNA_ID=CAMNT_0010724289 /DNA_START=137 /DNA_END=292 /DNA_ORIENTATION=+
MVVCSLVLINESVVVAFEFFGEGVLDDIAHPFQLALQMPQFHAATADRLLV